MPVYRLEEDVLCFPPAAEANQDGLLAMGGKLTADWLLTAYASGIFPWFNAGEPILWWSPDPRMVLDPNRVHLSKSMRPILNNPEYEFRLDSAFDAVMTQCAVANRREHDGTWITDQMCEAYSKLHKLGMAHSAEIWKDEVLVGGLYGVAIGGVFYGESMFSRVPNTSKLCLIRLCRWLIDKGIKIIDCQIYSEHLARMGAVEIPRVAFLKEIKKALKNPTLKGKWKV